MIGGKNREQHEYRQGGTRVQGARVRTAQVGSGGSFYLLHFLPSPSQVLPPGLRIPS